MNTRRKKQLLVQQQYKLRTLFLSLKILLTVLFLLLLPFIPVRGLLSLVSSLHSSSHNEDRRHDRQIFTTTNFDQSAKQSFRVSKNLSHTSHNLSSSGRLHSYVNNVNSKHYLDLNWEIFSSPEFQTNNNKNHLIIYRDLGKDLDYFDHKIKKWFGFQDDYKASNGFIIKWMHLEYLDKENFRFIFLSNGATFVWMFDYHHANSNAFESDTFCMKTKAIKCNSKSKSNVGEDGFFAYYYYFDSNQTEFNIKLIYG